MSRTRPTRDPLLDAMPRSFANSCETVDQVLATLTTWNIPLRIHT
jgi:hypothetical protein